MATLGDLIVRVGADIDQFEQKMGDVSKRLNAIDREAQRAFSGFDKLGDRLSSIGTSMTAAITLPLSAAGGAAVKFAADFELGMRKVGSLVGGLADGEFKTLSKATLSLARNLGIDAVKATEALYSAISSGIPKENALDFVAVASKAAIAGLTDTKVAVDALTTIIAAYGLKTTEAKNLSDAMFQAVNVGKFEFKDLAAVIGPAAQQASNLGISYQELLAATATLSISAGSAGVAVTQVESAMRSLLNPTKEMEDALKIVAKQIGLVGESSGSAVVKTLGFEGTLQALRQTTGTSAEAFNALFGRIEGATGALGLVGTHADEARGHLESLRHASDGLGATQIALNEINKATQRQFEILVNSIKTTAVEMGFNLLPSVNRLLQASQPFLAFLKEATASFGKLPPVVQNTAIAFTAALAAMGPLLLISGALISSIANVAKAFTFLSGVIVTFYKVDLPPLLLRMNTFATVTIPAVIVALRTFALTTVPNAILQIGLLSEIMLRQAVASFATFATTTIPAATRALIVFATTAIPEAIKGMTIFATQSIPAAISSLRTFTFSTIPAAITAMRGFAAGGIASATASLTAFATTATTYAIAALSALAVAATLAAAAFVAFKIGSFIHDSNFLWLGSLGDGIAKLLLYIPGVESLVNKLGGVKNVVQPAKDLETQVRQTEVALRTQGVAVEQGNLTLVQYASKLADLKKGLSDHGIALKTDAALTIQSADAKKNLKDQLEALRGPVDALGEALKKIGFRDTALEIAALREDQKTLTQAFLAGRVGAADYAAGFDELEKKIRTAKNTVGEFLTQPFAEMLAEGNRKLLEQINLLKLTDDQMQRLAQVDISRTAVQFDFLSDSLIDLLAQSVDVTAAMEAIGLKPDKALQEQIGTLRRIIANLKELEKVGLATADDVARAMGKLADAEAEAANPEPFRQLGIQSTASLQRLAEKAKDNYIKIRDDARSTTVDIQRAWVKMIEAQIAAGEKLPKETLNQYEKIKAATDNTTQKVHRAWADMSQQISTIVTDLSRGIADAIVNFKSLGDVGIKVAKDIATAILRTLIEGAIHKLANELAGLPGIIGSIGKAFGGVADNIKNATSAASDLGKVITGAGGVLGTTVGAAGGIPGLPNGGIGSPSDFPKLPGSTSGAGTGGAASGAGGLAGWIGAGAGIASAISGIIGNFQNARQEGTLNAIEQHTKVMAIALLGISAPWEKVAEGQDTLWNRIGDVRNVLQERLPWIAEFTHTTASVLQDYILPTLADILAFLKTGKMVSAIDPGRADTPIADLKAPLTTVVDNTASTASNLGDLLTALPAGIGLVASAIAKAMASASKAVPPAPMIPPITIAPEIKDAQSILSVPLLFGQLVDGFSNAVNAGVNKLVLSIDSFALSSDVTAKTALVESIRTADMVSGANTSLKDYIQPNISAIASSLRAIEQVVIASPMLKQAAEATAPRTVTINVNGVSDPAALAQKIMDLLKTQSPVFV